MHMLAACLLVDRADCWEAVSLSAGLGLESARAPACTRPGRLPERGSLAQVETEWERVLAGCRVLEGWVARGLALGFVGALTLELTSVVAEGGQTDFHKSLRLYRAVAGASLLVCAAVYAAAGLLCLGRLKRGALAPHGGSLLHPFCCQNSLFAPSGATEPQMVSIWLG